MPSAEVLYGREIDQHAEHCRQYLAIYKALQDSKEYSKRLEQKIRDKTPLPRPSHAAVSSSAF